MILKCGLCSESLAQYSTTGNFYCRKCKAQEKRDLKLILKALRIIQKERE